MCERRPGAAPGQPDPLLLRSEPDRKVRAGSGGRDPGQRTGNGSKERKDDGGARTKGESAPVLVYFLVPPGVLLK